MIELIGMYLDT